MWTRSEWRGRAQYRCSVGFKPRWPGTRRHCTTFEWMCLLLFLRRAGQVHSRAHGAVRDQSGFHPNLLLSSSVQHSFQPNSFAMCSSGLLGPHRDWAVRSGWTKRGVSNWPEQFAQRACSTARMENTSMAVIGSQEFCHGACRMPGHVGRWIFDENMLHADSKTHSFARQARSFTPWSLSSMQAPSCMVIVVFPDALWEVTKSVDYL